jgi:hypothetical protein
MPTRNYSPSTIDVMGDLVNGIQVEVPTFACVTYMHQDQWELFHVYGRVKLLGLYIEWITDHAGGATLLQFNYTFTTPAITVKPMCAVTSSVAAMVRGSRAVWVGGAVATATVLTVATGGFSDVVNSTHAILGGEGFIGTVGMLTTTADSTGGTAKAILNYVPMSTGAYVDANAVPTAPPG